jgi:hypothetical protein
MTERKISVGASGSIPNCETCHVHQGTVHCRYCFTWICGLCRTIDTSYEKQMFQCRMDKGCGIKRRHEEDEQEMGCLTCLSVFCMLFLLAGLNFMIRWIRDTTNTERHNVPVFCACIIVPLLSFIPICTDCKRINNKK